MSRPIRALVADHSSIVNNFDQSCSSTYSPVPTRKQGLGQSPLTGLQGSYVKLVPAPASAFSREDWIQCIKVKSILKTERKIIKARLGESLGLFSLIHKCNFWSVAAWKTGIDL